MATSATLGQLVVQLALDTAKWTGDLGKAVQETNKKFDEMGEGVKGFIDTIKEAAEAFAVVETFKFGYERGDQANNMAQQIGLTTEALTQFEYAAKRSDVGTDQLAAGFKELSKNASLAAAGNLDAERKFDQLGVSIYGAGGKLKDAKTLFLDMAQVFSTFKDGLTKSADATEIFGRSGAELIPFLNEGKDGLQELADRADKLGFTISENTAKSAAKFSDTLGDLKAIGAGLATTMSAGLLPLFQKYSTQLIDSVTNSEKLSAITEGITAAMKVFSSVVEVAWGALKALAQTSAAFWAASVQALQGNFSEAWDILKEGSKDVNQTFTDTVSDLGSTWDDTMDDFGASATDAWTDVKKQFKDAPNLNDTGDSLKQQWDEIMEDLHKKTASSEGDLTATLGAETQKQAGKSTEQIKTQFYHMWDDLDSYAQQGAAGIQDDFEKFLENPAKVGFKGLLSSFIQTIDSMVAKALTTQIFTELFGASAGSGPGVGLTGIFSSLLSGGVSGKRADGGPVSGGSTYLVGENGPELFTPSSSGGITANGANWGGSQFNHTYYIDAKGADADRVQQMLPSIMEQTRAATKRDIYDSFRRSGLPAPRI